MDDPEKRIRALLNLPSLVNWVRHNKRRLDDTIFQLREFSSHPPRHSLQPIQKLCADLAYRRINRAEALDRVEGFGHSIVRVSGREVIPEFCKYIESSQIEGIPEFEAFRTVYIIGKKPNDEPLFVPVKPTFVGIRNDKLVPVFIIPWVDLALDGYQKYLLSTIVCDSILTQQDFIGSDAEIIGFPRIKNTKARHQQGWRAQQYNLLSQDDLVEQFTRYSRALNAVINEIREQ